MPTKEVEKNSLGATQNTNTNQHKKNLVRKRSKIPLFVNTVRPSSLKEPFGYMPEKKIIIKPKKTTTPTVPRAQNESCGTKKVPTTPRPKTPNAEFNLSRALQEDKEKEKLEIIKDQLCNEIKLRKDVEGKLLKEQMQFKQIIVILRAKGLECSSNIKMIHKLSQEAEGLEKCIKELTFEKKTLEENNIMLEDNLSQLKQELETSKNIIKELQTDLNDKNQTPRITPREIHAIYSYKQKLDQSEKDLKSFKDKNKTLEKELRSRDLNIHALELSNTALTEKVNKLNLENFEKLERMGKIADDMQIQANHFHRVTNDLRLKEQECEKYKHGIKLYEEDCERNNNTIVKLKQKVSDKKEEIAELKKNNCRKEKTLFEPLTFTEITDRNLHQPNCKYSKHKPHK